MDQAFLEREKELFKLNAKLNSKAKKITSTISNKSSIKPVQIHTANSHFNYYDESMAISQKESQDEESLSCKKINISNQPPKKNHEIIYPLFNRHVVKGSRDHNTLDIHLPGGLTVADGKAEIADSSANDNISVVAISEAVSGQSFKNESLLTRFSDDSSAVAPAENITDHPAKPIISNAVPRTIEKKNISNDGLLK